MLNNKRKLKCTYHGSLKGETLHSFFLFLRAHWEAILLALLSENSQELRTWAVNLIIQIRQDSKPGEVRWWQKPNLIFDPMPEHYRDMVDWSNKKDLTENPATQHISNDDLIKIGTGEKNLTEFIPKVMSHSIGKVIACLKKIRTVHSLTLLS